MSVLYNNISFYVWFRLNLKCISKVTYFIWKICFLFSFSQMMFLDHHLLFYVHTLCCIHAYVMLQSEMWHCMILNVSTYPFPVHINFLLSPAANQFWQQDWLYGDKQIDAYSICISHKMCIWFMVYCALLTLNSSPPGQNGCLSDAFLDAF